LLHRTEHIRFKNPGLSYRNPDWQEQMEQSNKMPTIRSSNWRRYQARMVYSTFLHSIKNSLRSTSCSKQKIKTKGTNYGEKYIWAYIFSSKLKQHWR
jgi:hypothetical protein